MAVAVVDVAEFVVRVPLVDEGAAVGCAKGLVLMVMVVVLGPGAAAVTGQLAGAG